MVHLFFSLSKPSAQPPLASGRDHRTPASHLTPVHAAQANNDRAVAQENYGDEERHQHGVGQREGQSSPLLIFAFTLRLHLDKTPRSRTVLLVTSVSEKRQQAESKREEIYQEQADLCEASPYVFGVKIWVAYSEASLDSHRAQYEHRSEAEEGHGEGE